MNYHDYRPNDMLNGDGIRATLFVSGCTHGCKGCYNVETWDPSSGNLYDESLESRILSDLQGLDGVKRRGLSLTGGDPLHESNLETILNLVTIVNSKFPDKDIWLWTGYTVEEAIENPLRKAIIESCDYIIDGKFEQEKYNPSLRYRGSSNQNVYKHLERIL